MSSGSQRALRASLASGAVLIAATACGDDRRDGTADSALTRTDSAGITIVEHAGIPDDLPLWRIADEPDLRLGTVEGEGPEVFGSVEGVAERSDGSLVVADGINDELRAFDSYGRHLWTAGRRGQGPGEFVGLYRVFPFVADSVVAFDISQRTISVFDPAGAFVRAVALRPPAEGYTPVSVLGIVSNGDLVGGSSVSPDPRRILTGLVRNHLGLLLYTAEGEVRAQFDVLPDYEMGREETGAGFYRSRPVFFGRSTVIAVGPRGLAASTQDRFEVRRYAVDGTLAMMLRVRSEPEVIDGAFRSEYGEYVLSRIDELEHPRAIRQGLDDALYPQSLPAHGAIAIDAEDRLWVQEYLRFDQERDPLWWIFSSEGELIAQTVLRTDFNIQQIAADHLIGTIRDSLGVIQVERRPIVRGSG